MAVFHGQMKLALKTCFPNSMSAWSETPLSPNELFLLPVPSSSHAPLHECTLSALINKTSASLPIISRFLQLDDQPKRSPVLEGVDPLDYTPGIEMNALDKFHRGLVRRYSCSQIQGRI